MRSSIVRIVGTTLLPLAFLIVSPHRTTAAAAAAAGDDTVPDERRRQQQQQLSEQDINRQALSLQPIGSTMLQRLRDSIRHIEQSAADVDTILDDINDANELDGFGASPHSAVHNGGSGARQQQQQHDEDDVGEALKRQAPATATKGGRRYDSYGVAGRFGRSVAVGGDE